MSLKNNQGSEVSCFTSTKDGIYYGTNSGCIQFKVHSGKVLSITPISNSRIIATFADGTIKILGPIVKVEDTLKDNSNSIWKVIEIGEKLYSIGSDNTLKIWKKTDGNYKVEESIAIQGTPKDLTKVNEDEVIIKLENQNSAVFVNLKTKEQKTLEEFQNFESLDNSLFLVDNKIVLVEKNRLKLINPENKQVIFTLDNKDANILEVTCEKNLLTTIQSTEDKQLIGRVIFMVENDKIIKVNGGNFIKNTYELLDLCKYLEVQKEINEILDRESYTLLNPKQYSLITTDEDFKFFSNNINSNAKYLMNFYIRLV